MNTTDAELSGHLTEVRTEEMDIKKPYYVGRALYEDKGDS